MNADQKLDQIAKLQDAQFSRKLQMEELIRSVIPAEVQKKIDEIKEEFLTGDTITPEIDRLTSEVKDEVVKAGETIRGSVLMAVFAKGRVSWDDKALSGYAKAHPEILDCRKEGAPSVSIRRIT